MARVDARTYVSGLIVGVSVMWGTLLLGSERGAEPRARHAAPPILRLDQAESPDEATKYGRGLLDRVDLEGALKAFGRAIELDIEGTHGASRFYYAYTLHGLGRLEEAKAAHRDAARFPRFTGIALYNLACAHALIGEPDEALGAMREAIDAGFGRAANQRQNMRTDPDLVSIRSDPRFAAMMAGLERGPGAGPDAGDAGDGIEGGDGADGGERGEQTARSMDFWVGEWDCYSAKTGKHAGTNSFTREANGHAILERWRGAGGGNGGSWNHFNPQTMVWKQDWVSGNGSATEFVARVHGNGLLFEGASSGKDGEGGPLQRMLVRPLGDSGWVRQTGTSSADGGQSWTPAYDLVYVPTGEAFSLERLERLDGRAAVTPD